MNIIIITIVINVIIAIIKNVIVFIIIICDCLHHGDHPQSREEGWEGKEDQTKKAAGLATKFFCHNTVFPNVLLHAGLATKLFLYQTILTNAFLQLFLLNYLFMKLQMHFFMQVLLPLFFLYQTILAKAFLQVLLPIFFFFFLSDCISIFNCLCVCIWIFLRFVLFCMLYFYLYTYSVYLSAWTSNCLAGAASKLQRRLSLPFNKVCNPLSYHPFSSSVIILWHISLLHETHRCHSWHQTPHSVSAQSPSSVGLPSLVIQCRLV